MKRWTFTEYVQPNETAPVSKWVARELSAAEQTKLITFLWAMEKTEKWEEPHYKALSGKQQGLGELRLKGDKGRPLRLIEFKGPGLDRFTFLIGCTKDGSKYDPPSALDTAVARKGDLNQDRGSIREYEIEEAGEETPGQ